MKALQKNNIQHPCELLEGLSEEEAGSVVGKLADINPLWGVENLLDDRQKNKDEKTDFVGEIKMNIIEVIN